ncbi:MAG: BT4734/BF3469 family protein [Saprospiraceae bacterium]
MNCLNVEVSYFKRCFDCPQPVTVNLLTFLRSEKYRIAVEKVRLIEDKAERDALKKSILPGITPSGTFTHRAENGLVKHSGLIAGDVDMKDNPYTPESIKKFISGFENVAYCGLSASGQGLWFLVPIANPEQHKQHFAALLEQFALEGINLDPAPANVASFRFYSFDPEAYFNPEAKPLNRRLQTEKYKPAPRRAPAKGNIAQRAAQFLIESRATVAFGYEDYQRITAACQFEFGVDGESIAWDILENSPCFQASNFRKDFAQHWRSFKRSGGNVITGGTLVHLAKECGFAPTVDNAPPTIGRRSTPPPQPAQLTGQYSEQYTDKQTGQPFAVAMNDYGYPAAWDIEPAEHKALTKVIAENPAVTELIARFDLQINGLSALG